MKFKVGDKVRGTSDSYFYTDKNMSLGEVVNVTSFEIEIKIIEHSDRSQVGEVYWAVLPKGKFELVEEKKIDKFEELEKQVELYEKNIESQQQSLETLKRELEELKTEKENEPWKPKDGDKYWLISHNGYVVQARSMGDEAEDDIYAIGNVFRTKEEAEFRAEQLKVEAELRRFARPFKSDSENYTLGYRHLYDKIEITFFETIQCGNLYFPSKEIAKKAIGTVGEDRIKKYYFGVKD